jgi:hypothetical protein
MTALFITAVASFSFFVGLVFYVIFRSLFQKIKKEKTPPVVF